MSDLDHAVRVRPSTSASSPKTSRPRRRRSRSRCATPFGLSWDARDHVILDEIAKLKAGAVKRFPGDAPVV